MRHGWPRRLAKWQGNVVTKALGGFGPAGKGRGSGPVESGEMGAVGELRRTRVRW
jgi:hypothetical protein